MKKTVLAATLILGAALTAAASDQSNKPSTGPTATGATQNPQTMIQTPFKVWPDGNWIFVVNYGNADWTSALDVWATCKPVAPTASCGPNFASGKYHAGHFAIGQFPKGHGNALIKAPRTLSRFRAGLGRRLHGAPYGSFKVTATAANNTSPETDVTLAAPVSPIGVNPATLQLAPTKTPVRKP
ncbi:MAG: hypothetical protein IPL89_04430 [Acidobacteria bacterium]|nr:hypothetical protein [Acidobacteriota bacterium]